MSPTLNHSCIGPWGLFPLPVCNLTPTLKTWIPPSIIHLYNCPMPLYMGSGFKELTRTTVEEQNFIN